MLVLRDFVGGHRHQGFFLEGHAVDQRMRDHDAIPIVGGDHVEGFGNLVGGQIVHVEEFAARIRVLDLIEDRPGVRVVGDDKRLPRHSITAAFHGQASHGDGLASADLMGIKPAPVQNATPDRVGLMGPKVERLVALLQRHPGEVHEGTVIGRSRHRVHGIVVGGF